MTEKLKALGESTPVALGLACSALAGVIAVTVYITTVSVNAQATAKDVAVIQADTKLTNSRSEERWIQVTNALTEIKADVKYLRKQGE